MAQQYCSVIASLILIVMLMLILILMVVLMLMLILILMLMLMLRQLLAYHEVLDPGATPLKTKLLHELRKVRLALIEVVLICTIV